ncbi:hypothetical protein SDC9_204883 [bioreactor metagenome]|uniref:Uncharacterized protein n=1 Tax=bioreactor metagenome TaxID=1076179 RepID=A0A645J3A4_9ZZZZ
MKLVKVLDHKLLQLLKYLTLQNKVLFRLSQYMLIHYSFALQLDL